MTDRERLLVDMLKDSVMKLMALKERRNKLADEFARQACAGMDAIEAELEEAITSNEHILNTASAAAATAMVRASQDFPLRTCMVCQLAFT